MWGFQDTNNYYRFDKDNSNDETGLRKLSNDSLSTLGTLNDGGPIDSWTDVEVEWNTDGSMVINVSYNSSTITATDTEFTNGGIGWRVGSSSLESTVDAYGDIYEII